MLTTPMNATNMLMYDSKTYRSTGNLADLKSFVNDILNLKGKWTSPGGNAKLFSAADAGFVIKWFGIQSQKLVIQVDNEENYLKKKFESLVNEHESNSVCSVHNIDDNATQANASKLCGCSCSVELEGLKLGMTILESRLQSALSQSELESDVRSLTVKLKELEAVIRHQDEVICALNDDNEFFKARLLAFEKIPVTEAHNKNELRVIDKATTSRISDQINKSNLSLINSEINNTSCIINHPCDSEQCNASVLIRNQVDLTNDVLPPSKQQLIQQKQSSVSRVNDDSVMSLEMMTCFPQNSR